MTAPVSLDEFDHRLLELLQRDAGATLTALGEAVGLSASAVQRRITRYRKSGHGFDAGGMQSLLEHSWPGNIRELDHAIERAVLLAQGELVRAADLGLRAATSSGATQRIEDLTLEEVEKLVIQKALTRFDGNVSQAAKALGLSRSALYRRLETHEI